MPLGLAGTIIIPPPPPMPVLLIAPSAPYSVDITYYASPTAYQGQEGSCDENAIYNMLPIMAREAGFTVNGVAMQGQTVVTGNYNDIDRNALYYNERTHLGPGYINKDTGSNTQDTFNVMMHTGTSDQKIGFKYDPSNLFLAPSADSQAQASHQLLTGWTTFDTCQSPSTLAAIVATNLYEGHPVMMDFMVFEGLERQTAPIGDPTGACLGNLLGRHDAEISGVEFDSTGKAIFDVQSWQAGMTYRIYVSDMLNISKDPNFPSWSLNGLYTMGGNDGLDQMVTQGREKAASDYVAVFGRSADHGGAVYFGDAMTKGLITETQAIGFMMGSQEYKNLYGNLSDSDFVGLFYHNVLGRTVDAGGLAYWDNVLKTSGRDVVMGGIIACVRDHSTDLLAHQFFTNASIVSLTGAITYQDDGSHYAADVLAVHSVTQDITTIGIAETSLHHILFGA